MRVATLKSSLTKVTAAGIALVVAFSLTVGVPAQAQAADLMAGTSSISVSTQAVKAPTSKNYKSLLANLTKRFSKGGKSAALNNSSTEAAFALNVLGKKSKIDIASVQAQYNSGVGFEYGKSAGTVAKYAVIMQLAGSTSKAKTLLAEMESLMTSYENAWSAPWILMAYHLMGKKPSSSAAMTEKQLAKAIVDSQTANGWFGGEYGGIQTTAQGVIALEGVSSVATSRKKAVKAILAAQNKDGGFYDGTAYSGGYSSNLDATGTCILALYRYGKKYKNYAVVTALNSAADYLVKKADSSLDGYEKNSLSTELMSCSCAFAGLASAKAAASLKFPVSKATVAKISKKKYTGKAIKPKPVVKYNGKKLKKGTDYKLSYSQNVNAGTAKVKITGKGNFKGSKTVKFKIVKK